MLSRLGRRMKRIVHHELGEPSRVLRVEDAPSAAPRGNDRYLRKADDGSAGYGRTAFRPLSAGPTPR